MTGPEAASDAPVVPRVSVIIPAYNSEGYLASTLDSVRDQTLPAWELIVYDDGSTDGTVAVAEQYAARDRRIRVGSGANAGVAAARNQGFAMSDPRSDYVIFLDNDDQWEPDALATLVGVLDAHPDYVSAHCLARCIDGDGNPPPGDDLEDRMRERVVLRDGHPVRLGLEDPTTFAALAIHNWVVTPGTHLIRRSVLERVGGFDVDTPPADDWDMNVRVARLGDIGYVDRPLLRWRRHAGAQSNSGRWRQVYHTVRRKMMTDPANTPEQTRAARSGYVYTSRAALHGAWRCLVGRRYGSALREGAKSARHYALYLRTDVPLRISKKA
jgi:glycosyltransferase involved in cell wall biosynthesis